MIKNLVLYLLTILMAFIFVTVFDLGVILTIVLSGVTIGILFGTYGYIRHRNRHKLLDEDLDPEAFIIATEKQIKVDGKNKQTNATLNLDLMVGLICMRRFEEALDILNKIEIKHLSKWDGHLLIYYCNKIGLYYSLGKGDKALEIYENNIKDYPIKRLFESLTIDLILAYRAFHEKEYNSCKELFNKVLQNSKSKRLKLQIYYLLANIAEEEGNIEEAIKKYKIVAEEGNKLASVSNAKEKLKELSM